MMMVASDRGDDDHSDCHVIDGVDDDVDFYYIE